MSIKFYDTNCILNLLEKAFEEEFVISSKTLEEIEHIKVSDRKDADVKYRARKLAHLLDKNKDKYEVIVPSDKTLCILRGFQLEESPDNIIMACAYDYYSKNNDMVFASDDICCKIISKNVFRLNTIGIKSQNVDEMYKGFKEVILSDSEMAYFYEHLNINIYELNINEYLVIKDKNENVVDKFKWDGEFYNNVKFGSIKSCYFGTLKPYEGDVYQQMALNSLSSNQVTMLKGSAGTGKSYLALGYLFYLLEKHKIEKIIVFCNTVATANSAKLGFYPGSKDEKLLDSSIGNMLGAKLGGKMAVEQLILENKLVLLPMSDVRGFDTTGMNAGVYVTEAQNMDIGLMKLALQRIGSDCICVIDGDFKTQVDMSQYSGANNGMKRMSEVFRGHKFYGEVELQNIYRSEIAKIAELMWGVHMKKLGCFIAGIITILFALPLLEKILDVLDIWLEAAKIKPNTRILEHRKDTMFLREFLSESEPIDEDEYEYIYPEETDED